MSHHIPSKRDRCLAGLDRLFSVSVPDARDMIRRFHAEMRKGLAGEQSSLKMIPCFVGRPKGTERGRFLALDLGGTNCRVLEVALDGKGGASIAAVSRFVIPRKNLHGAGEKLFDFLAGCLVSFFRKHPAVARQARLLAFTFSFPVAQSSLASGTLIGWTKGFTASGVEGRDVVALLSEAIERKGLDFVRVVALTNDTIGTLVAECYSDPSCDMGVILGTGTNACYPEKITRIRTYRGSDRGTEMIINMEWGNYNRLETNSYDEILDTASPNAGRQRLEKMVSGLYLGEIARLVIRDWMEKGLLLEGADRRAVFSEPYGLATEHLSRMARGHDLFADFNLPEVSDTDRKTVHEISRLVSRRSARIAGAAIVAVLTWMDPSLEACHTVAIDGALFEKHPGYQSDLMEIISDLCGDRANRIKLVLARDGSGIGSAIVGAMAVREDQDDAGLPEAP